MFYRCASYYLTGNENNYKNVKDLIIQWIENNYNEFLIFFGDDENNNIKKEVLAKHEFEYIKKKDSWGSYYTIEITCMIFNLTISVYISNGNNYLIRYNLFNNYDKYNQLMIIEYKNRNHFNLIYENKELNNNYFQI